MGGRTSAEAGAAAAAVPAVTPMINSPWVDPFPPWLPPKPSEGESTWSIVGPAQCADRDWVANFVEESAFRNGSFQRCIPLITCGSQQEWSCSPRMILMGPVVLQFLGVIWLRFGGTSTFLCGFTTVHFKDLQWKHQPQCPCSSEALSWGTSKRGLCNWQKRKTRIWKTCTVGLIFIIFYNHSEVDSEHGRSNMKHISMLFFFFLRCPCCIFSRLTINSAISLAGCTRRMVSKIVKEYMSFFDCLIDLWVNAPFANISDNKPLYATRVQSKPDNVEAQFWDI